ncbi:hypothetical protein [Leeuwenhoekiella sp. H156]|uniref:hypothetical protein n=1 Tax=Leeuwenhoekiella sp. H156 TaxID=3450128 RepID=UPI003FA46DF2
MRNLLAFIFVLSLFGCEEHKDAVLDKDAFLVGTLDDYMGREKFQNKEDLVDYFALSEKQLGLTIDSIFKTTYADLEFSSSDLGNTDQTHYGLYSKELTERINTFYDFEASGRMEYTGEQSMSELNLDSLANDQEFLAKNFDTIYTGKLKPEAFKTHTQKLSFITGAYFRYGSQNDSQYQIRVSNSVSKAKLLNEFLLELGCDQVEYEIQDNIPNPHTLSFVPTEELKQQFELFEKLR